MKKQNFLLTLMLFLALSAFGYQNLSAQCPGGGGCATCNPIINNITRDFLLGTDYFYSSSISICSYGCIVAVDPGAFEWYIDGCPTAVVISNGNGFARINIPCPTTGLKVCMRFKAITPGGLTCWSQWYCEPI